MPCQPVAVEAAIAIPSTPTSSSATPMRTALTAETLPLIAPPTAEAKKAPPASHRSTRPLESALRPSTFCNQSGIANSKPNSPIEIISAAIEPFLNDATLNRRKSRRTFLFAFSRAFSQKTKRTKKIIDSARAKGITEIAFSGQLKFPIEKTLSVCCHQP